MISARTTCRSCAPSGKRSTPARGTSSATLQSSTAHRVADHADVVQTVAGERAARRLARRAARSGRTLDALIEVDLTEGRTGVPAGRASGLRRSGRLARGSSPDRSDDRAPDRGDGRGRTRLLRPVRAGSAIEIQEEHPDVLALSMGMSLDYEVAVEEGATMVRIGTALFGPRAARPGDREEPT